MLGPNNELAALEALKAWPNALQVGGGINDQNAKQWIENGAKKVISQLKIALNARLKKSSRLLLRRICFLGHNFP